MGRNATPLPIIAAAHYVLDGIELDVCSDEAINQEVQADRILTIEDDGFRSDFKARTVFCNAPGDSCTGGTFEQRLRHGDRKNIEGYVKPKEITTIKASQWYRRVYDFWKNGAIESAIILVYRGGSFGSLGVNMLRDSLVCLTASGAPSRAVNGSGRFAYEIIDDNGCRHPETANTQSSAILCLTKKPFAREKFVGKFSDFGVVFDASF